MNTFAKKPGENQNHPAAEAPISFQQITAFVSQLKDMRSESLVQARMQEMASDDVSTQKGKVGTAAGLRAPLIQRKPNNTGLPDHLKSGIEHLSGYSMDDVKVHYNSNKPAKLNAHAYAQGSDIHVASGQEKHLPHEAWHVVQQKQGRVKPTMQLKGSVNVNDDVKLEKEADVMGVKALHLSNKTRVTKKDKQSIIQPSSAIQLRARNPYNPNTGEMGVENITAHHIIPHSFLKNLLSRFNADEKTQIKQTFTPTPESLTLEQLVNLNELKIEHGQVIRANQVNEPLTAFFEREGTKTAIGEELANSLNLNMHELGDSFYEWQAGNQFHGPKERAEPGTSDEFDFDGRFAYDQDHIDKLNEVYEKLKPLDENLKKNLALLEKQPHEGAVGYLNRAIANQRQEIRQLLFQLSNITKNVDIPNNNPNMWKEVDLSECQDILNENIFETKRFRYYNEGPKKLPKPLIREILAKISSVPDTLKEQLPTMRSSKDTIPYLINLKDQPIKKPSVNLPKKINSLAVTIRQFTVASQKVHSVLNKVLKNPEHDPFSDFSKRLKDITNAIKAEGFTEQNLNSLREESEAMEQRITGVEMRIDQLNNWLEALA